MGLFDKESITDALGKAKKMADKATQVAKTGMEQTKTIVSEKVEQSKQNKLPQEGGLIRYEVTYEGGHPDFQLGKKKSPYILLDIMPDRFSFLPKSGSADWMRWVLAVPLVDRAIYAKIRNKLVEAFGGEFEEVIIGGAPLNSEVEEFLHKIKFPFTVGYGMTECGPLISYTPWRQFIPTSCGRVLPNMEAKIVSDDPANIPGEICVRGQNRMKGYYKNPDVTAATIDEEGWLHTGDMGTLSDGTLFIRGRYKTMILSASGQNIYPEEIEAKLNNMPYVGESLVVERGKGLTAIVYPDYERMDSDHIDSSRLPELMEQNRLELNTLVAPYEKIDHVQLIPYEFEKTPKKSIKRYLYS